MSQLPQEQAVKSSDEVHIYWTKLVRYVAVYLCFLPVSYANQEAGPPQSLTLTYLSLIVLSFDMKL